MYFLCMHDNAALVQCVPLAALLHEAPQGHMARTALLLSGAVNHRSELFSVALSPHSRVLGGQLHHFFSKLTNIRGRRPVNKEEESN